MTKPPDFFCVQLPEICRLCGDALLEQAKREIDMHRITRFCPHNGTLIHADLEEMEGSRGIVRWGLIGPVDETEALKQMTELAEREGVEVEVLHDSERVH